VLPSFLIIQNILENREYTGCLVNFKTEKMPYKVKQSKENPAEKRIAELSAIFKRLYEDSVTGRISDERFTELSADYEAEQKELKEKAAVLQGELSRTLEATANAEKFMKVVRKYTSFEELTPTLLREFVEKIVVHESEAFVKKHEQQQKGVKKKYLTPSFLCSKIHRVGKVSQMIFALSGVQIRSQDAGFHMEMGIEIKISMKMDKIYEQTMLFDFYGELLTEHQRRIYEDVVYNDMSLGEIAEEQGISRQGVHDLVKRCDKILQGYENKLHLVERFARAKETVSRIEQLTMDSEEGDVRIRGNLIQIRKLSRELLAEL